MKYAVLFDSRTGNTALIAEEIRSTLKQERCVGFGMQPLTGAADVVFLGSWCDRGGFSEEMRKVISGIHHQKVALFANFDHALSHPDETDLKQAEAFALRVAAMIDAV